MQLSTLLGRQNVQQAGWVLVCRLLRLHYLMPDEKRKKLKSQAKCLSEHYFKSGVPKDQILSSD